MARQRGTRRLLGLLGRMRLSLAVFALFVVMAVTGGLILRDTLLQNAYESYTALSRYYASETDSNLVTYEALLEFGTASIEARVYEEQPWDSIEEWANLYCERLRTVLGNENINLYGVVDGRVLAVGVPDLGEGSDPTSRAWYRAATERRGEPVFTDVYEDAITGEPVVTVAEACTGVDAVLAFDVYPESFQFRFATSDLPEGVSYFLCDSAGVPLYARTDLDPAAVAPYLADLVSRIDAGEFEGHDANLVDSRGERRAVDYTQLSNGWYSVVTTPYSLILGDLNTVCLVFVAMGVAFLAALAVMGVRDWRRTREMKRSDDTVHVLGNSYYAIYLVNYGEKTYEVIKGSEYVNSRVPSSGPYADLMGAICEVIEDDAREEFREHFSAENVASLVKERVRDFGGDFRRLFGNEYRWVNVRVLYDESFSTTEAILCFREVDAEKRAQLQERRYLEDALATAREGMRAKQAFFNNMSHDMRTPLNAIIGLTDLASREEGLSDGTRRYLARIEASGRQLLALINDILDISQMEQGAPILSPERMSITACVRECAAPFEIQARDQGKEMSVEVDVADDWVTGDPVRLGQVVNNLLSNALKYTRPGDSIRLALEQGRAGDVGSYRITVADTGIGMAPEYLDHLFEVYSREQRFGTVRTTGTGLGMPITKNLVGQMGGDIRVESEVDHGTTFVVTLPFAVARDDTAGGAAPEGGPLERVAGLRVLVAEDNDVNMEIALEMLEMAGVDATPAWDGSEALEAFRASEPYSFDAILMDMRMPVMDGCAATSAIRALDRPDAATVPIVAVTANAFAEDIVATTVAGMDAHVAKPIDFPALFSLLAELVGRDRARRAADETCNEGETR